MDRDADQDMNLSELKAINDGWSCQIHIQDGLIGATLADASDPSRELAPRSGYFS
jgi:hypothetical protein